MVIDFISSLYSALEKQLDRDKYVIGVGRIQGGAQFNRIPDSVEILGSYRSFDMETTNTIDRTIKECLDKVAEKYMRPGEEYMGYSNYDLDILHGYPVLVNDPAFTEAVHSKLQESFPELTIYPDIEKTFAAEDFSAYLQIVPGIFISLGTRNPEKRVVEINHSCTFDIDEEILITGTKIFHTISLDFLKNYKVYLGMSKSDKLRNDKPVSSM
jgi:metal-dependent amidase/aminoacylase/carboxypeptidase family protein